MHSNTEKPLSFYNTFQNQPYWLQKILRKKMMQRCGWESRTTFYNKLQNETPIKLPEQAVITQIFEEHGLDAWTGKEVETLTEKS